MVMDKCLSAWDRPEWKMSGNKGRLKLSESKILEINVACIQIV